MNKKIAAALVLLLLALCVVFILNEKQQTGFATIESEGKKTVKIGAILPLTTENAYIGQDWREGVELFVAEFNEKNRKEKIEVVFEDSQSDPKTAIIAFNKLKEIDGANVFVTTLSSITLALAPLAEKSKVPLFTIATAPSIRERGEFVFVNNFSGEQELSFFVDFIEKNFSFKKLSILAQNNDLGVEYNAVLQKKWKGNIVATEFFDNTATDYRTQLAKIKNAEPDFVFIVGYAPHLSRILPQAKGLGIKAPFFSGWFAHEKQIIETAKDAAEGLTFTSSTFGQESAPEFFEKYQARFGREPHYRSGLAFDIMGMLAAAIEKCGWDTANTECVKDKIYEIKNYNGVTGSTTVNSDGGTTKEITVWQIKNGGFVKFEE